MIEMFKVNFMDGFWEIIMTDMFATIKRLGEYTKSLEMKLQAALEGQSDPAAAQAMQARLEELQAMADADLQEDTDVLAYVGSIVPDGFQSPSSEVSEESSQVDDMPSGTVVDGSVAPLPTTEVEVPSVASNTTALEGEEPPTLIPGQLG